MSAPVPPRDPPRLRNDCFALPPGVAWTPVDAALEALRARCACVAGTEEVALADAAGRILAAPVDALRPNPPRANSAVDGWAFAHASLSGADPERLTRLPGRAAPGADAPPTPAGGARRI
ncbi:MAG: bifunctional molybdopterin-guanine dinucleotide biosynthesis protein MobB/molybdopterin molybdotransferase MoeA, partial [Pseudomonadota bacterium]